MLSIKLRFTSCYKNMSKLSSQNVSTIGFKLTETRLLVKGKASKRNLYIIGLFQNVDRLCIL